MYEKLSIGLAKHGIEKNGEQCRSKIKKLHQEYKKIKDAHNKTGTDRKKWRFYDSLNEILGNRPATCPPVVIDTSDEASLMQREERAGDDSDRDNDETVYEGSSENNEGDGVGAVVESSDLESSSHSRSSTPINMKGKKRRRSKGEVIEDMMAKVMKSVTEGLKSDKMFLELEEKRLKFEEQQKREERVLASDDSDISWIFKFSHTSCSPE